MPKKPVVLIVLIGIILMIAAVYLYSNSQQLPENIIAASGTIESNNIDVSAEVAGPIQVINVEEGQRIKVGDVIAKIESTDYDLRVKQSEAVVAGSTAKANEIKSGSRKELIQQAEANVQQIEALVEGANASVKSAEDNFNRIKALFEAGGATQQQLDEIGVQLQNTRARYESLKGQLKAAEEQLLLLRNGASVETVNTANAQVKQAQAALEIAKNNQLKTIITSPIEGIVSSVNFDKGEIVNMGASIATISDPNDLWIQVYIPETKISQIKVGLPVKITIDAYPNKHFSGEISYISSQAEFTPKNVQTKEERVKTVFAVKVKVKEGFDNLKPGLPADVLIEL